MLPSFDRWKKTPDSRQIIHGRSEITTSRMVCLRVVHNYQQEDAAFVYVEDIFVYCSHYTIRIDNGNEGDKAPMNKGHRLIIIHAGEVKVAQTQCATKLNFQFIPLLCPTSQHNSSMGSVSRICGKHNAANAIHLALC